jgi:hypothetical protein
MKYEPMGVKKADGKKLIFFAGICSFHPAALS